MATEAQIRANRANAQKSRGPKTAEGKARSRLNALKHGLRAEVVNPVAPHEDPAELEARIQTWLDDYQPTSAVERDLVERAAKLSWSLDRIERYEAALLARRVRKAMVGNQAARAAEVCALARKLFYMCGKRPLPDSGPEWDDNPWAFVAALEESPEGTRWMIDRWNELARLIDSGAAWTFLDQFKFIRLLGKHPVDAADDPELNAIVLAWEAVEPGWGLDFWRKTKDLTPLDDPAFNAWRQWRALVDASENAEAAWALLRSIVDRELKRLKQRVAILEEVDGADALELAERALFSTGDGAERLRRLQTARTRELLRTLDAIAKLRKAETPAKTSKKAPNEANPAEQGAERKAPTPSPPQPRACLAGRVGSRGQKPREKSADQEIGGPGGGSFRGEEKSALNSARVGRNGRTERREVYGGGLKQGGWATVDSRGSAAGDLGAASRQPSQPSEIRSHDLDSHPDDVVVGLRAERQAGAGGRLCSLGVAGRPSRPGPAGPAARPGH